MAKLKQILGPICAWGCGFDDDHQALSWGDLVFEDDLAVIITAKDAIKLVAEAVETPVPNLWVLEIEAEIENAFIDRLVAQLHNDTNS